MKTHMIAWATALIVATPGAAQEDFRNVDRGRPARVEDAYPVKWLEWEWELGGTSHLESAGNREFGVVAELKAGVFRNGQVGVEIHSAAGRAAGVNRTGLESAGVHALYNFNQETLAWPAFGLRADLMLPGAGDLARNAAGGGISAIVTKTLGSIRSHVNGGVALAGSADGGHRVQGGVAFDRALGLNSQLLIWDVFFERDLDGGDTRWWVDAGLRIQISKSNVLDVGLFTRADDLLDGDGNIGLTVGLSRAFGITALVAVPPYPNPAIR